MAIIKMFETPQGVDAKYHKIIKAEIIISELVIRVVVAIYASSVARDAGKSVLWHEYVDIPFSALTQDPRDLLYPMVAAFGSSYLHAGQADAEGSGAPGNFNISLKPEAMVAPVVLEHPAGPTPEEAAMVDMGPQLPIVETPIVDATPINDAPVLPIIEFNPVESPPAPSTPIDPETGLPYVAPVLDPLKV
jgi:hypothetical protein